MKCNEWHAQGIEVFTPEDREMPPQFSTFDHSFIWIMLPISGVQSMSGVVKATRQ